MRTFLSLLAVVLVLGLGSCKKESKDPARCSAYWATELEEELTTLTNAAMAYITDPSSENCIAYKEACQDYVDAVRPYANCSGYTAEQRQEIQEDMEEWEAEIEDLNCDEAN